MNTKKRRMQAEWEPQSMVQLTWPHKDTDWAPILPEITAVYEEMAREICKREKLLIAAPEGTPLPKITNCQLSIVNSNDTWARDHGFITVEETSALGPQTSDISPQPSDIILLDFKFNGWGEKFEADLDNQINRHLYDAGCVTGNYESHLDFVLEGGSIESDGKGTIFTTTCCLMAPHRNQPLTQAQIEARLKEYLGAERVVWLNHGSLIGDDTDGHIDTLVHICPDDTIVYTGGDADHPDLALMEEELRALRTLEGRPYRLLKLPLPRPIYDPPVAEGSVVSDSVADSDRLPATYANYLVINGAVLVPTYAQPDLDAEALRIIGEAYPDREIIGIDCRAVIKQHGSLHCCTMQYYQ
ncbi:agmatine deiminase family protein [Prevotella communis]|uniref:agmatine deiminase family protein n=1 Tax=Prevotella communis TaxID=2913614 RepID=UPI001EDAE44F|nr:agmatine deiminase family protein [Prevotella communis]UKK55802.1 agmatine deiminase family protein [Prevotella communis]